MVFLWKKEPEPIEEQAQRDDPIAGMREQLAAFETEYLTRQQAVDDLNQRLRTTLEKRRDLGNKAKTAQARAADTVAAGFTFNHAQVIAWISEVDRLGHVVSVIETELATANELLLPARVKRDAVYEALHSILRDEEDRDRRETALPHARRLAAEVRHDAKRLAAKNRELAEMLSSAGLESADLRPIPDFYIDGAGGIFETWFKDTEPIGVAPRVG